MRSQLEIRCYLLRKLFNELMSTNSRIEKEAIVLTFRTNYPKMNKDLDFCFEVLAGYHKLGYTYVACEHLGSCANDYGKFENVTVRAMVNELKRYTPDQYGIAAACAVTPPPVRRFIENLVNRKYKLGYSNKQAMITSISPMLAKKYPETFREGYYYIQEKLDGNRCIAKYNADTEKWEYYARSGKPLKVDFDMSWADTNYCYDGEIMTLAHAGTRDFNRTSGAINSKYGDKSGLHYFIYDIIAEDLKYKERWEILQSYADNFEFGEKASNTWNVSPNVSILRVLSYVWVNANVDYNERLDKWLDYIVDHGGEGIILRDPDGIYEHKRSNNLIKYKKTWTMDLRIIGWNVGKGKYEGAIGSFICETDDHKIKVNVAGMSDDVRWSDPVSWLGKIIEVAYFDTSKGKNKDANSLRFPRFKRVRDDKNETSTY